MHTRRPTDRLRDQHGRCDVCGQPTRFLYSSWAIPSALAQDLGSGQLAEAYRRRESLWCSACGANSRARGLWQVILKHFATTATSVTELVGEPGFGRLRIAEINRLNAGHELLSTLPGVTYSEYPEEDMQALSYPDEAFDLVITSDTLEHIPDPGQGIRETRRVLRHGGRHILTVPLRPDLATSQDRTGLKPIHHGGAPGPWALFRCPGEDMLARHDFALDFLDLVADAGFDVELHGDGVETVICALAR